MQFHYSYESDNSLSEIWDVVLQQDASNGINMAGVLFSQIPLNWGIVFIHSLISPLYFGYLNDLQCMEN